MPLGLPVSGELIRRPAGWPAGWPAVGHFILILIGCGYNGRSKTFNMATNALDVSWILYEVADPPPENPGSLFWPHAGLRPRHFDYNMDVPSRYYVHGMAACMHG
jgi:hypothetical protein